jgi:hypothetical protein
MGALTERKQGYALDADVDRTRLVDQAKVIDRISERYMLEGGIAPGMRVLDLGSGMGDVALLAGRLVGPEGHVLGVERSPELRSEQDLGGGMRWSGYEMLAETVRASLPLIEAAELGTAEEIDVDTLAPRLRAAVVADGAVAASPVLVGALGRA